MRQLFVLEGLDPRDRDYEQHRAGALSPEEFEHWQRQPPQLPLSALVAALVDEGGTDEGPPMHDPELVAEAPPNVPSIDRLAAAGDKEENATGLPGIMALAPSGGPGTASMRARRERWSPKMRQPRIETRSAGQPAAANRAGCCARCAAGKRGAARGGRAAGATASTSGRGWSSPRPIWSAARR